MSTDGVSPVRQREPDALERPFPQATDRWVLAVSPGVHPAAQKLGERFVEFRVREAEAACERTRGNDALAVEQQRAGHFAEDAASGRSPARG